MLTHLILTIPYEGGTVITLISQMVKSLSGQVTCPKPQSVHEGAGTGTRSLAPLTGLSLMTLCCFLLLLVPPSHFLKKKLLQLIYNVMLISVAQQSDSVIHTYIYTYQYIHIYIHFHILFHYGLSQDIEYSSLYYTAGPYCYISLYSYNLRRFLLFPFSFPPFCLV